VAINPSVRPIIARGPLPHDNNINTIYTVVQNCARTETVCGVVCAYEICHGNNILCYYIIRYTRPRGLLVASIPSARTKTIPLTLYDDHDDNIWLLSVSNRWPNQSHYNILIYRLESFHSLLHVYYYIRWPGKARNVEMTINREKKIIKVYPCFIVENWKTRRWVWKRCPTIDGDRPTGLLESNVRVLQHLRGNSQ